MSLFKQNHQVQKTRNFLKLNAQWTGLINLCDKKKIVPQICECSAISFMLPQNNLKMISIKYEYFTTVKNQISLEDSLQHNKARESWFQKYSFKTCYKSILWSLESFSSHRCETLQKVSIPFNGFCEGLT